MPYKDPSKRAAVRAKWQAANKDAVNAKTRRWYYAHQDEQQERLRTAAAARYRANPEAARAQALIYRRRRRQELINAYGGCCACCAERELAFLTLDHANGDGAAHRRSTGGNGWGHSQDKNIAELRAAGWPRDGRFRILCWNCQWGWRRPEGCPHQAIS